MSQFDDILGKIKSNAENHETGYFNCIPFSGMPRFSKYVPGLEQATYYCVTANSGVGKSKIGRKFFIHDPLKYVLDNPNLGIELDIFYFTLEESKEKIILSEISSYLHKKYNISVGIKQLQSKGKSNKLSPDVIAKVEEARPIVEEFLSRVRVIDNVRNPTGIYKMLRDFANGIGDFYDKDGNILNSDWISTGRNDEFKKIHSYRTHNPRHYVLIYVDHVSLLSLEDGLSLHGTMGKFSSKYALKLRDRFGFTPIAIQQQASDKEKQQYTHAGKSIEDKLEPSLDGLGNNKELQRDYNVVFGLFAPNRYGIESHMGHDITFLKDNYRCLTLLKDRDGISNIKVPLFFNGAVDLFKEMPKIDDVEGMTKVRTTINRLRNN